MRKLWSKFVRETDGQDLIEYALLAAIVALGAVIGMRALAGGINQEFTNLSSSLGTQAS